MDLIELQRRADSGSCVAQTALGLCFLDGIGTEIDLEAAYRYLRAAAQQGGSREMANLGHMYFEGVGVSKDVLEAFAGTRTLRRRESFSRKSNSAGFTLGVLASLGILLLLESGIRLPLANNL